MNTIIAVNKDITVYEQLVEEWLKYGIDAVRTDAMHEAIARISRGEKFYFIIVNEDSIPCFMLQLPFMRDITDLPIFVFTNSYSTVKQARAISLGADVYAPFSNSASETVLGTLELLKLKNRWAKRPHVPLPLLVSGDIVLSQSRRRVFVKGIEVSLTKKEFDILSYLMSNHDIVLSYRQLYRRIWGSGYDEAGNNLVWNHIHALRQKINKIASPNEYIINEKDVGYRFIAPFIIT